MEDKGDLKFVYERKVAGHIEGKVIDYHTTPSEGFSIRAENEPECSGDCNHQHQ